LRLGLVVPRFGEQISGGAELHARWLAERLAAHGHDVDVFTTCAVDHRTWRNELPAGMQAYKDLRVRRFPVSQRDLGIHGELDRAISSGFQLSADEEILWLRHGASSEAMEEYLSSHAESYDAILAMPYLFGTTYFAYAACPSKAVIIPCLHDEPFAYLHFVQEMLSGARGLLFNTGAEVTLARRIVKRLSPWGVVGVGFDAPPRGVRAPRRYRLPEPSILYVGRREAGKNTPILIDYFVRYRNRRGTPLHLAFAGAGDPVPNRPDIIELKPDWKDPYAVYRSATIACQPSFNESLSIVLLQAWLAEVPALVHGSCAVTREHCERSNGGLWFSTYAEFEAVLDRILGSRELRDALAANGRNYVEREYSWPAVLGRFNTGIERILSSGVSVNAGTR
jgi:glycosyltransferase involved in cell wall biosynthesis